VLRGAHAILEAAGIPLEDFVSYAEENGHKAPEFPNQETNIQLVLEEKGKGTSRKDVIETVQLTESTESPDRVASFVNDVWTGKIKPKDEPAPVVTPATGTTTGTVPVPIVDGKVRVIDENRAEREVTEAEFNAIVKDVGAYLPASNRVRLPNGTTMPADKFRKHPKWHLGKGVTGKMRKGAKPSA